MSERNVELHRSLFEAYNAGDVEAMLACCDPGIEFQSAFALGGIYRGHNGWRKFLQDMRDAWGDEIRVEPEAYFDLGERSLTYGLLHGHGGHSGADVVMPLTQAARWRDGLIVHLKSYAHREDALRDLGVSEDELEPIAP
jgi:ketosteroid isomerase-like protein